MRQFFIALAIVVFFSSGSARADSVLDVSIAGVFTANQSCSSNCLQVVNINFQFDPDAYTRSSGAIYGYAIPGTVNVSGSGFLGSFYSSAGFVNLSDAFMPFFDDGGDELDIRYPVNTPEYFPVGIDTIYMEFWGTNHSPAYINYLGGCCAQPAFSTSRVTPVASVPEPSIITMLLCSAVVLGLVIWRKKIRVTMCDI